MGKLKTELEMNLERAIAGGGRAGWEAREFIQNYRNRR